MGLGSLSQFFFNSALREKHDVSLRKILVFGALSSVFLGALLLYFLSVRTWKDFLLRDLVLHASIITPVGLLFFLTAVRSLQTGLSYYRYFLLVTLAFTLLFWAGIQITCDVLDLGSRPLAVIDRVEKIHKGYPGLEGVSFDAVEFQRTGKVRVPYGSHESNFIKDKNYQVLYTPYARFLIYASPQPLEEQISQGIDSGTRTAL